MNQSEIKDITIHLTSDEQLKTQATVMVKYPESFRNNIPCPDGTFDPKMGSTDKGYNCSYCGLPGKLCRGHCGYVKSSYPILMPLSSSNAYYMLKIICHQCGGISVPDKTWQSYPMKTRIADLVKSTKTSIKSCPHCGGPKSTVKKDKREPMLFIAEYTLDDQIIAADVKLLPHAILVILSKISDQTCKNLGINPLSHPRNYVRTLLEVPPVYMRPQKYAASQNRSSDDDITKYIKEFVTASINTKAIVPKQDDKTIDSLLTLSEINSNMIKGGPDAKGESLTERIKSKEGQIRFNILGKRVWQISRSVIACNPNIPIDCIVMPFKFAKILGIEEKVTKWNIDRLQQLVNNGEHNYPGATRVSSVKGGFSRTDSNQIIKLTIGDTVHRHMVDGDPFLFNRQPTLKPSNISQMYVIVNRNPQTLSYIMNELSAPLFNADFDGDQMNGIIQSREGTRIEIEQLSNAANWFISHESSSPAIGQINDTVIGSAMLTKGEFKFTRYHAMLLFGNCTFQPVAITEGATNRTLVSEVFSQYPFNYSGKPTYFQPNLASIIDYAPEDITVKVESGKLISGVIDKAAVGKGKQGNCYHKIASSYGNKAAIEVMFNHQQMIIEFSKHAPVTVGIKDFQLPVESRAAMTHALNVALTKANELTQRYVNGQLIPSLGLTEEQFFEEQIKELLSTVSYRDDILRHLDPNRSFLYQMVLYGSKGTFDNMFSMAGSVGQRIINGDRLPLNFSLGRSSPYFTQFPTDPLARGNINSSFAEGLSSVELFSNAAASRFDLISKSSSTAVTGEQNRNSNKALECVYVNYHRSCVEKTKHILTLYGDNGIDTRSVILETLPTIRMNNSAVKSHFIADNVGVGASGELSRLLADRDFFREYFMRLERSSIKDPIITQVQISVCIDDIVTRVINVDAPAQALAPPSDDALAAMVTKVDTFCAELKYVFSNQQAKTTGVQLPEQYEVAVRPLAAIVRTKFSSRKIVEMKLNIVQLELILNIIYVQYQMTLIDPGACAGILASMSYSEPLTQYMLDAHHRSATGGTSKNTMVKNNAILSARPTGDESMFVRLRNVKTAEEAERISKTIEEIKFGDFYETRDICFEEFGKPIHPRTKHEETIYINFAKQNPGMFSLQIGNLTPWCIRYVIERRQLAVKNITLDEVVRRMRIEFPNAHFVYTGENVEEIVIRVHLGPEFFLKLVSSLGNVEKICEQLEETIVRGISGIRGTLVRQRAISCIDETTGELTTSPEWFIETAGSNYADVLTIPEVDPFGVLTDSVQETLAVLGIAAANNKIIQELRGIISTCGLTHYFIYAGVMTYTGRITSTKRNGVAKRGGSLLLEAAYGAPIKVFEKAANLAKTDILSGISGPALVGVMPKLGSNYTSVIINEDFVAANTESDFDYL
jgi:DNA-directed RNA polymerase II subunit RPB1